MRLKELEGRVAPSVRNVKGRRAGGLGGKVFTGKITRRNKTFRWMVNVFVGMQLYLRGCLFL